MQLISGGIDIGLEIKTINDRNDKSKSTVWANQLRYNDIFICMQYLLCKNKAQIKCGLKKRETERERDGTGDGRLSLRVVEGYKESERERNRSLQSEIDRETELNVSIFIGGIGWKLGGEFLNEN